MSKSNAFETALQKLVFQNIDLTGIGDAGGLRGSAAAGSLYLGLYTADPGEAGSPSTSETTYTGYSRKAVARSTAEWSESGGVVSLVNSQIFGQCTAGPVTLTHFAVLSASSGGIILYSAALTAAFALTVGVSPRFLAGALTVSED